jgi:hypothetical protein
VSAVRDVVWLGVSNGLVVEVWTQARRDGRKVRRRSEVTHPVSVLQVHRGIWDKAMALADGDAKRIQVLSPTHVEVMTS